MYTLVHDVGAFFRKAEAVSACADRPFSRLRRDTVARKDEQDSKRVEKDENMTRPGEREARLFWLFLGKGFRRQGANRVEEGRTRLQTGAMIRAWNSLGVFNSSEIWFTKQRLPSLYLLLLSFSFLPFLRFSFSNIFDFFKRSCFLIIFVFLQGAYAKESKLRR